MEAKKFQQQVKILQERREKIPPPQPQTTDTGVLVVPNFRAMQVKANPAQQRKHHTVTVSAPGCGSCRRKARAKGE